MSDDTLKVFSGRFPTDKPLFAHGPPGSSGRSGKPKGPGWRNATTTDRDWVTVRTKESGGQMLSPQWARDAYQVLSDIEPELKRRVEQTIPNADIHAKLDMLFAAMPDNKARRTAIHKIQRRFREEDQYWEQEDERLAAAKLHLNTLNQWMDGELKLQKSKESLLHHFKRALIKNWTFDLPRTMNKTPAESLDKWLSMLDQASVYVVQHDWASAFAKARDFDGGEIHLPDDFCAFEFRVSDRNIIAFADEVDGVITVKTALQTREYWTLTHSSQLGNIHEDDTLAPIVHGQIRAIAIALDAEVATSEVVRAPHKLNHAREQRGELPMYSYHIVNLARRKGGALPLSDGPPQAHRRLHFRRGHWRHYEHHKTWINWQLIGNPELGFVDKEYRL